MARAKEPYPLQKVTLNLRSGDWNTLRVLRGREGASKVIRDLVKDYVDLFVTRRGSSFVDLIKALKDD